MPKSPRRHGKALASATAVALIASVCATATAPAATVSRASLDRQHAEAQRAKQAALGDSVQAGTAPTCAALEPIAVRTNYYASASPDCTYNSADGIPSLRLTDRPDHGNVDVMVDSGHLYYFPDAGFQGTDTVKFVMGNAGGDAPELTATFTVSPTHNTAPRCYYVDGRLQTVVDPEGNQVEVGHLPTRKGSTRSASGYCFDLEGDDISFAVKTQPAEGLVANGARNEWGHPSLDFTPAAGTAAGTLLTAIVAPKDEHGLVGGDVTMGYEVLAADANSAPSCESSGDDPGSWSTYEVGETNEVYDAWCHDREGDAVTLAATANPAGATVSAGAHGLTVTPAVGSGQGTFTYRGTDSRGAQSELQTIGVKYGANHADPACLSRSVEVPAATRTEFDVTCADADPSDSVYAYVMAEGHGLAWTQHGDLEVRSLKDGKLRIAYTPDAGFSGADGFLVGAHDTWDSQATDAKVTLNVAGAPAGNTGGGGGKTPTSPPAPTADQAKAAMTTFLTRETGEFLQLIAGQNKKGIDAAKAILVIGTLDAGALPNGGTGQFDVYDKAGKTTAARAAAAKRKLLGTTKVTLAKGQSKKVQVRLNKKGKALLKKKGKVKLTVDATLTDALTGAQARQSRTYTFKVKKKRR